MKRRVAREKALQALFQVDVGQVNAEEALQNVIQKEKADEYLKQLLFGTVNHLQEIDEVIKQHLEKWSFDRLAKVDRNILRLAVYEMKYIEDVPVNVSINEAVELAKIFGDERSNKFVNGVLSKVKETIHSN
ncbi:transcription antitermination factor NusB [Aeribacillus pallidus]|jgi:transcription antitermination protein NusB|uniref:transcription antitermination factor NusB n=1 Tax=Aeribacillus pallidus TaxID=33936 RepID=UPI001D2DA1FA|nr:transcription antitermination factor NusB [Bacillus sp. (in: firmicutes)]